MSDTNSTHLDADAVDRYRRRDASAEELLASDAHLASCDRCHALVRAEDDGIELPQTHLTYDELEAYVDGRADALDRELVAAHAACCELCSKELGDLIRVRDGKGPRPPRVLPQVRPRT